MIIRAHASLLAAGPVLRYAGVCTEPKRNLPEVFLAILASVTISSRGQTGGRKTAATQMCGGSGVWSEQTGWRPYKEPTPTSESTGGWCQKMACILDMRKRGDSVLLESTVKHLSEQHWKQAQLNKSRRVRKTTSAPEKV